MKFKMKIIIILQEGDKTQQTSKIENKFRLKNRRKISEKIPILLRDNYNKKIIIIKLMKNFKKINKNLHN